MSRRRNFKLTDPAFLQDLGPDLDRLRSEGPLVRLRLPIIGKVWATTTDEGARALLKSGEFCRNPKSSGGKDLSRQYWWLPRFMGPLLQNMLLSDGADHSRLRSAVDRAFMRTSVEDLRPDISRTANILLDRLNTDTQQDLLRPYARALPLQVICLLLGISDARRDQIERRIAPISGPTNTWTLLTSMGGLRNAMALLKEEIEDVRRAPRDGVLSALVIPDEGQEQLTEDEILAMAFMLFIAGHETTVHLISNGLYSITQDPELRRFFCGTDIKPQMRAIEELLRFHSPVMMTKPLYAKQDMMFQGTHIKSGEQIVAFLAAANRDPARFDAPHDMCPSRKHNPHLTFGFGPHVCLGMQLARAEAQIALHVVANRFPNLQWAGSIPPTYSKRVGMRGLTQLPLKLRP